jgi:WD40 repeat protein
LQKYEYRPIASGIRAICWSPDNRKIIVVGGDPGRGGDGICISYDTGSSAGQAFSGHSKPITCVAIRPVPPFRIITGSEDTSVVFHEGPPFKFMKSCQTVHSNFVNGVAFSPDGSRAFSCGSDGIIAVFTGDSGDLLTVLDPKVNC